MEKFDVMDAVSVYTDSPDVLDGDLVLDSFTVDEETGDVCDRKGRVFGNLKKKMGLGKKKVRVPAQKLQLVKNPTQDRPSTIKEAMGSSLMNQVFGEGYIYNVLDKMASSLVNGYLNVSKCVILSDTLFVKEQTLQSKIEAVKIAVNGKNVKVYAESRAAAGVPTTVLINGSTFFGVIIRIAAAKYYGEYKPVRVTLTGPDFSTVQVLVYPTSHYFEFCVLTTSAGGSVGAITGSTSITVTIAADEVIPGTVLSAEGLNARDIGSKPITA